MAENSVNGHGGTVGFDDLPYFQDYLQNVLRPRVERAIETVNKSLTEAAWRQVIAEVAAEQPGTTEAATALLRPLLESKLGLKIEARLASQFGAAKPVKAPGSTLASPIDLESDSGVTRVGGPAGADVITVRRQPVSNPLANAVVNSRSVGR